MAGMNGFFARALTAAGEGMGRLMPWAAGTTEWAGMKSAAAEAWTSRGGRLGMSGAKQVWGQLQAMKTQVYHGAAETWSAAVGANPGLADGVRLNKFGSPKMSIGQYFAGATVQSRAAAAASGGSIKEMSRMVGNNARAATRLGVAGALAAPIVTGAIFGSDSPITNFTRTIRNMGASTGTGLALGAIHPGVGMGWAGLSGYNAIRGAGFSPLGTFS